MGKLLLANSIKATVDNFFLYIYIYIYIYFKKNNNKKFGKFDKLAQFSTWRARRRQFLAALLLGSAVKAGPQLTYCGCRLGRNSSNIVIVRSGHFLTFVDLQPCMQCPRFFYIIWTRGKLGWWPNLLDRFLRLSLRMPGARMRKLWYKK